MVSAGEERRKWALAMMGRARGPIVAYGSPEWHALPDGPEKVAAVIKAAECYVIECQLFDERLEAERKSADDRAWLSARERHRAAWDAQRGAYQPDPALADDIDHEWRQWVGEAG